MLRLFAVMMLAGSAIASAEDGPQGITTPTVFPPFVAGQQPCSPPPGLKPVIAFAQDNARQFMDGVGYGLKTAARDRGFEYRVALAGNDAGRQVADLDALRNAGVGGVVVAPVDPTLNAAPIKRLIWSGSFVGTVVPPPATEILNAPQYLTGKVLGEAAAAYIVEQFGGKANVVLLTQDTLQFLAPRFTAMRDVLAELPGVTIIADISPNPVDEAGGFATMNTILLANVRVDVVLGADAVVLGALKAIRAGGRERPDQFFGGIDGETQAVAEIKAGGPYRISVSLNAPVFGYALGQHAADWMEGRRVPQAMDILPSALTIENLAQYEADLADPGAVYADPGRRNAYLQMYGDICYDTRDRYVNFPWSSEAD